MTESMLRPSTLDQWSDVLRALRLSPYVGPRPQTAKDRGMLIGRETLLEVIEEKVQDSAVLVLDGDSGSGKTSLLQNGLTAQLKSIGFQLLVCRRWPAIAAEMDIDEYLGALLRAEEANHSLIESTGLIVAERPEADLPYFTSRLGDALDRTFEGSAVLVLDQFEELLRQHPADASRMMDWIRSVADSYQFRIVLSLRSDATHLLDPHLKGFRPYLVDQQTVSTFTDSSYVEEIIDRRREVDTLPDVVVTPAVTKAILDAWRESSAPQLLGLQALLSALYFTARDAADIDPLDQESGQVVTIDKGVLAEVARDATDLFEAGMFSFITRALKQAEEAAEHCDIDAYLRYGAKELVTRTAQFLWSAGFKVPASERELAARILAPELRLLGSRAGFNERDVGGLVTAMLDSGDMLNFGESRVRTDSARVSSRNDVTAGPLLGSSSEVAVFEEARRAAFAIAWLTTTGIARRSGDRGRERITLVHDGSGVALERWASVNQGGIDYDVHRLTAARGEHLDFSSDQRNEEVGWPLESTDFDVPPRVIPNLNWRDCRITALFTGVVFLNCDFSGARFESCRFEGVTFVNCLLDDANFEECEVVGVPDINPVQRHHDASKVRIAPSFEVQVAATMSDAFSPYVRRSNLPDRQATTFFSDVVGSPALPGATPLDHRGEVIRLPIARRGVAFVGGRISFLTFHSSGSSAGDGDGRAGAVEFYYAGGGGLDIVEPRGTSVVLYDCAVRGVSVTRDQQEASASSSDSGLVSFQATDSFLVYVYFSGALKGEAVFRSCVLWGVINASGGSSSEESSLAMTISGCRHQFIVNVDAVDPDVDPSDPERLSIEDSIATGPPPPYFVKRPDDVSVFVSRGASGLAGQLDFMDFRRESEVRELRQRNLWAEDAGSPERSGKGADAPSGA